MEFSSQHNSSTRSYLGKRKKVGALRQSHLLMTYGPGALVDMPEVSVIMGACDYWEDPRIVREPRLGTMLGVKCFKMPRASDDYYISDGVVRAMRFPYWYYCSKCGRLGPYWIIGSGRQQQKCSSPNCNGELIPSRFVAACEHGHIEDFPYEFWVHHSDSNRYGECLEKQSRYPKMKIEFSSQIGGLDSIVVICQECGAKRSLVNSTAKGAINPHYCVGMRPWVGNRRDDKDPNGCGGEMRVLQRGASNVYYPVNYSALTIPSYRSKLLDEHLDLIAKTIAKKDGDLKKVAEYLSIKLDDQLEDEGMTAEELIDEYTRESGSASVSIRTRDILEGEYRALTAPDTDTNDFKTVHVGVPEGMEDLVQDVVLVKRLKEVLALAGFKRVIPENEDEDDDNGDKPMSPFVGDQDWLPAMELRGEGIFITIEQDGLSEWAHDNGRRYDPMGERLASSKRPICTNFSPSFVMLHTLAHVLIRQLTIDCGYSGSSLKERIYSSWRDSDQKMSGILIYTSASDSDGSLGGLVRQGYPDRLADTFKNALSNASWCSSDPICSESKAQGFESLNYAACHACALLPETSCAMKNCLLDRVSVVGTIEHPELGFFGRWMSTFEDNVDDSAWRNVFCGLYSDDDKAFARRMLELGVPVPDEVGYDEFDEAMAELAWTNSKICYLAEGQLEDAPFFESMNWKVIRPSMTDDDIRTVFG